MQDFNELLDMKVGEAERPRPLPVGTYRVRVSGNPKQTTSREKKTPGLIFTFAFIEAQEDVDADQLAEAEERRPLGQRTINETFWLTQDSMFRFREFLEMLGVNPDQSFRESLPQTVGQEVLVSLAQSPNAKGDGIYNNINGFNRLD